MSATPTSVLARNAGVLVAGRILGGVLALGTVVLLTRGLTVSEFGVLSYAITLLNLVGVLAGFGGNNVATAEMARSSAEAPRVLGALFSLRVLASIAACVVFALFVAASEPAETRGLLLVAAPFLLFSAGKAFETVFQVRQRMGVLALTRLSSQLFYLAGVALLAATERLTLGAAILIAAAGPAAGQILALVLGWRVQRPELAASPRPALRFLGRTWPLALATAFGLLAFHVDTLMLRFLEGPTETGIYGAGYRVFAFAITIPALLTMPLLPEMAKSTAECRRRLKDGLRWFLPLGIIGAWIAGSLAPLFVTTLYDAERYAGTVPVLEVLCFSFPFLYVSALAGTALVARGAQRTWMFVTGIVLVLNLVLNVVLIPRHGAVGAAAATVATEIVGAVLGLHAAFRLLRRS